MLAGNMDRGRVLKLLALSFLLVFSFSYLSISARAQSSDDKVCAVYFTQIGCPNCKVTDPVVLKEWTENYDDVVIIEMAFHNWGTGNSKIHSQYASMYNEPAAVPQLYLDSGNCATGRLTVLNMGDYISSLDSNYCFVEGGKAFSELDLNGIDGDPLNIWANGRFLTRLEKGSDVSSDFLRELLFTDDLDSLIQNSSYTIETVESEPVEISGGEIEFEGAAEIEGAWVLKHNSDEPTATTTIVEETDEKVKSMVDISIFGVKFGELDLQNLPLPTITIALGLLDGFNPCAMFILCFLLVFLVGTKSRKKVFLVGGIFLFISGLVYFLFITAWFNFFLFLKFVPMLKFIVGTTVIIAGIINIKDYFFFQEGVSLTLPKSWKPKVMSRMKSLANKSSLPAMIAGVVTVAFVVNVVELMCTLGFPMIYTQMLSTYELSQTTYYLYILLYCVMYMVDDFILFSVAVATLNCMEMTKKKVRIMKLISGIMMVLLAIWFVLS